MPKKVDQPAAPGEWPPRDPAAVAPTKTRAGRTYPDLYNHIASRVVSFEEARDRQWLQYWDGSSCRNGHVAAKWVSNPDRCSDCVRVKEGKPPIYPTARHQQFNKVREPRPVATSAAGPAGLAASPPEPDPNDRRFLTAYAEHRNLAAAARTAATTPALIESRRVCNPTFAAAMSALEERLSIPPPPLPAPSSFKWTEALRRQLIRVWIDTGSLEAGRNSIEVSPSQYFDELAANLDFAHAVKAAEPLAARALLDRATELALQGNDKLLQRLLAAELPEKYGDRVRVDLNDEKNLNSDQLRAEIFRMLTTGHRRTLAAELCEVIAAGPVSALPRPELEITSGVIPRSEGG